MAVKDRALYHKIQYQVSFAFRKQQAIWGVPKFSSWYSTSKQLQNKCKTCGNEHKSCFILGSFCSRKGLLIQPGSTQVRGGWGLWNTQGLSLTQETTICISYHQHWFLIMTTIFDQVVLHSNNFQKPVCPDNRGLTFGPADLCNPCECSDQNNFLPQSEQRELRVDDMSPAC